MLNKIDTKQSLCSIYQLGKDTNMQTLFNMVPKAKAKKNIHLNSYLRCCALLKVYL